MRVEFALGGFLIGQVGGIPLNALKVPNGRAFPVLGHLEGIGGGPLSCFGIDFRDCDGDWNGCLCMKDSDGDGETNGIELGDPCCTWRQGLRPKRTTELSDPSKKELFTGTTEITTLKCDSAGKESWEVELVGETVKVNELEKKIHLVSNIGVLLLAARVAKVIFDDFKRRGRREKKEKDKLLSLSFEVLIAAYLWSDFGSAITHIVFDNPKVQQWFFFSSMAASFQEHHIRPEVLSMPPFALMAPMFLLALRESRLRIFALLCFIGFLSSYLGHLYSHSSDSFQMVLLDIVLLSRNHHNVHHVSYASNFAFLSGWTDPVVNGILFFIPRQHAHFWFFFGISLWNVLPYFFVKFVQELIPASKSDRMKLGAGVGAVLVVLMVFGMLQMQQGLSVVKNYVSNVVVKKSEAELMTIDVEKLSPPKNRFISPGEIRKHSQETNAWIVIGNQVLDVSQWICLHPGGIEAILPYFGYNATLGFNDQDHSQGAKDMFEVYQVGFVKPGQVVPRPPETSDLDDNDSLLGESVFLQPVQGEPCFGPPVQLSPINLKADATDWQLYGIAPFEEKYARGRSNTFGIRRYDELATRQLVDLSILTPEKLQITPVNDFYIRTGLPATLQADHLNMKNWMIDVDSMGKLLHRASAADIHAIGSLMGSSVMECSGNTRTFHYGFLSQANWTKGVVLSNYLSQFMPQEPHDVLVEGYDKHISSNGGGKGASWVFTWTQVVETGMFLATEMNGEPLLPDHGFPIRLVVPNWYGCTCIKWVNRISFVDAAQVKPTSQMREFRSRVHMQKAPSTTTLGWNARQGLSAIVTRVEQWHHVPTNSTVLKFVGLLWGGQAKETNPLLLIEIKADKRRIMVQPMQVVKPRSSIRHWTPFCHVTTNTFLAGQKLRLGVKPKDTKIYAPRLRPKLKGQIPWYTRTVVVQ